MVQWIKDWAPILATIGTLLGVLVTVRQASKSYVHGLIEKRKDHQRELLADLIATAHQWCQLSEISYMAMAKMSADQTIEYANTDSVRVLGEYATATRVGLIKCLSEIGDPRINPLVSQLEYQRRTLLDGDEAKRLFDTKAGDKARFESLMVVLPRLWAMTRTCDDIQLAAIKALPVEIDVVTLRRRFWNWLKGTNLVINADVAKHY